MSKIKYNIALLGGRGFVGQEIIKIIDQHNFFDLSLIYSSSKAGEKINSYHKNPELKYSDLNDNLQLDDIDIVICALPNGESSKFVDKIEKIDNSIVIIDIGSDYRFDNNWFYSIPEINNISSGNKRISNPGCYATASQLSIAPIKDIINSKVSCIGISGYSGAGATPNDKNNPKIINESIFPYSLSNHTHEKEIKKYCYNKVSFSPHVADFFRGILVTSHFSFSEKLDVDKVIKIYDDFYKNNKLIKIQKEPPLIKDVVNTNYAIIGGYSMSDDGHDLVTCCVIDNLLKGAASQCIQNLNVTFGFEESLFLEDTFN
jgi:N-acetyl-gamma-glutamyl-phosphate reductase common form